MTDSEEFDARPVRTFRPAAGLAVDEPAWPAAGGQAIVATYSPVVAAVPGANLLELGPWGIRPPAGTT